ncbi:hypothetical protein ACTXT7_007089 [Hymenolepis weldensis]
MAVYPAIQVTHVGSVRRWQASHPNLLIADINEAVASKTVLFAVIVPLKNTAEKPSNIQESFKITVTHAT